jgi:hypothetical protein
MLKLQLTMGDGGSLSKVTRPNPSGSELRFTYTPTIAFAKSSVRSGPFSQQFDSIPAGFAFSWSSNHVRQRIQSVSPSDIPTSALTLGRSPATRLFVLSFRSLPCSFLRFLTLSVLFLQHDSDRNAR